MKSIFTTIVILICSVSLMGCNTMTNSDVGAISGGVAGGLIGSTVGGGTGQLLAIAAGTLAGAVIGGAIGKSMDDTDKLRVSGALNNNSVGEPAYWRNKRTGATYRVVPTRDVSVNGNKYCREYRTVADIGGRKQQMYGTACRQPDGSWKAVR